MTVDLKILEFWKISSFAQCESMVLSSSRIRFTCNCSTPRCSSRHRRFRRPRCHQVAFYSAPLSSTFRGSSSSKMVSWHSSKPTRFKFAPFLSTNTGHPRNTVPPWCIYHGCTLLGFKQVKMNGASGCSVSKPGAIKCIMLFCILMKPHC